MISVVFFPPKRSSRGQVEMLLNFNTFQALERARDARTSQQCDSALVSKVKSVKKMSINVSDHRVFVFHSLLYGFGGGMRVRVCVC